MATAETRVWFTASGMRRSISSSRAGVRQACASSSSGFAKPLTTGEIRTNRAFQVTRPEFDQVFEQYVRDRFARFVGQSQDERFDYRATIQIEGDITAINYPASAGFACIELWVVTEGGIRRRWAVECGDETEQHVLRVLRPGDRVIVAGPPVRTPAAQRMVMQSLERPSDGFTWRSGAVLGAAPLTAESQNETVYNTGNGVSVPAVVRQVKPDYTPQALDAGIQGGVILDAIVRADGEVGDVKVRYLAGLETGARRASGLCHEAMVVHAGPSRGETGGRAHPGRDDFCPQVAQGEPSSCGQGEHLTRQRRRYTRRHGHSPEAFQVRTRSRTFEEEEERSECREARHCQAGAANQEARRGRGLGRWRSPHPRTLIDSQHRLPSRERGRLANAEGRVYVELRAPRNRAAATRLEWRCSSRPPRMGTSRYWEACSRKIQAWFASICRMGSAVAGRDCTRRRSKGTPGPCGCCSRTARIRNAREAGDNTYPLHWAAAQGHVEIVPRPARRRRGRSRVWRRARARCYRLGDLLSCSWR